MAPAAGRMPTKKPRNEPIVVPFQPRRMPSLESAMMPFSDILASELEIFPRVVSSVQSISPMP